MEPNVPIPRFLIHNLCLGRLGLIFSLCLGGCDGDNDSAMADPHALELERETNALVAAVGRMDTPIHSGGFGREGEGADVQYHRLEGTVVSIQSSAERTVELSIGRPETDGELRELVVDRLYPRVDEAVSISGQLRTSMGEATSADPMAVGAILAALDSTDTSLQAIGFTTEAFAEAIQEPILRRHDDILGPLNPSLLDNGNILLVASIENRVLELAPDGSVTWEHTVDYPTDAQRLASGNTLIASRGEAQVLEVTPSHEIVWSFEGEQIYGIQRLDGGNTLITIQADPARLVEVAPDHTIVWEYGNGSPQLLAPSCERLANGNTLVADNSGYAERKARVFEIDPAGTVVWEFSTGLYGVYGVHRLSNGNTMINDQSNGRIVEVSPAQTIVWRYGAIPSPGGFAVGLHDQLVLSAFGGNRVLVIDRSSAAE